MKRMTNIMHNKTKNRNKKVLFIDSTINKTNTHKSHIGEKHIVVVKEL